MIEIDMLTDPANSNELYVSARAAKSGSSPNIDSPLCGLPSYPNLVTPFQSRAIDILVSAHFQCRHGFSVSTVLISVRFWYQAPLSLPLCKSNIRVRACTMLSTPPVREFPSSSPIFVKSISESTSERHTRSCFPSSPQSGDSSR